MPSKNKLPPADRDPASDPAAPPALTPQQKALLAAVGELSAHGQPASVNALSEWLRLSVTAVRKRVDRLMALGLLLREYRPRGHAYVVSPQAQALLAEDAAQAAAPPARPALPAAVPDDPRRNRRPSLLGDQPESGFDPSDLDHMVVSPPLAELLEALERPGAKGLRLAEPGQRFDMRPDGRVSVIIDLNLNFAGGQLRARQRVHDLLVRVGYSRPAEGAGPGPGSMLDRLAPPALRELSSQYVFALLTPAQIRLLVTLERRRASAQRAVFRLWPDHIVETQATAPGPLSTIKADAARATFGCAGEDIVWAVIDSGIDGAHPHFERHGNLRKLPAGISHRDFVAPEAPAPLLDRYGHGTHVAGIIAGSYDAQAAGATPAQQIIYERDGNGVELARSLPLEKASGVAPACQLVSFKVLRDNGQGPSIGVIAALEEILRVNGYGKANRIHGVNLSVGYPFEPRWFACGHSPLCEVVDRLVRSGVVVVTAAGNNGYALTDLGSGGVWGQGRAMSITDPGNAERAITVGSTHREAPHTYGVSYFSSKGPTGDGRRKPDLLAPGENIVSCASGSVAQRTPGSALYKEDSGTSMAAPHVSGAIAAFLSVRREFIGNTEAIKRVFLDSALDLQRNPDMQGRGLLDLLRALQSV